ncbi:DUF4105 domain-containing protein [Dysgonomonas sp. 25]|uniref:lipoprotein N-acyltransferase Lnb domain-containing protein n=1 Tax=Dysgonomonas sp. 25 TaxID=2302933 RepID=UPI0013D4CA83|nr:DUF4105 domain-containing protein [Dysgonomonas sp. 25]NDV67551.1 DUF4105 domain-containing protein [Dysgonomonas sp. 25]
MKHKLLFITIFLAFVATTIDLKAESIEPTIPELSDSAEISIVTNEPWTKEVYSVFGHTVIRVKDPVQKIDLSFNYGVFDFASPNFMGRFMTGATDYMVLGYDMSYYFAEFKERGVAVYEQRLNLTQEEKENVWEFLIVNVQPENRVYRYNFLYDNCATRPRDILEQCVNGKINYTPSNKEQTYRDLIHECVDIKPWLRFGIDLVIGGDADKVITDRQKDFLPRYLQNAYRGAVIERPDGTRVPLVASEHILIPGEKTSDITDMPSDTPLIAGWILFALTAFFSYLVYKKNKLALGRFYATIIFLVAGFLGGLIFFLMYFSEHPCVNPNWNLVWLNPLQFIIGCLFFVKPLRKHVYYYHFINFVALLLFTLAWGLIPQKLEFAFLPYIMSILLISGTYVMTTKKVRKMKSFRYIK